MKKVALLIAFIMLFTALATYAQVDVTVTGSSELVFGVSLDSEASGFTNSNNSKIAFTLASDSSEKGAEEAVYGWIKLSGWKFGASVENDGAPSWDKDSGDVEAKIMFPGGWVKISGTNNEINYVNVPLEDNTANDTDDKGLAISIGNSGGFVVGINAGPAAIELGVFSVNDWTQSGAATSVAYDWVDSDNNAETAPVWTVKTAAAAAGDDLNNEHQYGATVKAVIDVAPAKIEVGGIFGLYADSAIGFGGKVTLNVAPLTIVVGGDVDVTDSANVLYEVAGGVDVALMDGVSIGLDAIYNDATDDDCDVTFSFSEAGAGGMVDNLGLGLEVLLEDISDVNGDGDVLKYVVELNLDYLIPDTAKPYVTFGYGTFTKKGAGSTVTLPGVNDAARGELADANAYLTIGAELYMITNVVIKAEYSSGTLMGTSNEKGTVILSTKISY